MAVGIVVIHMSILARVCLANKRFAPNHVFAFVITMASQTQLTWYGHAAFKLVTPAGNVLLIDPWLPNPVFENGKDDLAAVKRVDAILLTHGHGGHVGDAVEIRKRTGAQLTSNYAPAEARKV